MRNNLKNLLGLTLAIALPAIALIAYTQYEGVSVGAQNVISIPTIATSTVSTTTVSITNPVPQIPDASMSVSVPPQTTTTSQTIKTQPTQSTPRSPNGWYYVFVAPDDYHKNPGSTISFTGNHFYPSEIVTITQNGTRIGSVQASASGTLSTNSYAVPYTSGTVNYVFTGSISNIPFTIGVKVGNENPWITLSNYYAGGGQTVIIKGNSFGSNEQVALWFGDTNLGTVTTDAHGAFSLNFVVPAGNTGQVTVTAMALRTHTSATQSFSQAY